MSDMMDMEFDFTEVKDVKEWSESGTGLPEGFYHVTVFKVEQAQANGKPQLKFHFLVLAGTNPTAVKRKFTENYFVEDDDRSRKKLSKLAACLGLFAMQQAAGQKVRVNWQSSVGRHLVVQLEEREYEDKKTSKMKKATSVADYAGAIWSIGDEAVAACPKNAEELAGSGIVLPKHPNPPPLPGKKEVQAPGQNGPAGDGQPKNWGDV